MAGVKIEDVRKFALEKELDEDLALKIVEQTLKAAYKTAFKTDVNAVVITGDDAVSIYARKKIVDDVVNPVLEVDIEEATKLAPDCELGDDLLFEDSIYSEYKAKEGEIIIGYYQRKKNDNIYVDLGKVEGLLPRKFQLPQEIYHPNDRIKALIKEVKKHRQSNVVQLILSRTDPDFVRRLMELEVPEIYDNIV